MDKKNLLGASFDCSCGREHSVPTRHLLYGSNCFESLVDVARSLTTGKEYLVIADSRTFEASGSGVVRALERGSAKTTSFIVPDGDDGTPVADDTTKDWIINHASSADLYIAVGSGVINDLVKWVAFQEQKPYITVPTAASMNGYGSANVAATVDGLKVLFHAEACRAVFVDPEVLVNAPFELTTSGLGDVLAKSVSSADWKLNQFLFDDYFCQFSVDLLKDLEPIYLDNPEAIKAKEPSAIKALFDALFYSSVAMTITGTSSPASGGEHLISHTLDMLAGRDSRTHDFHGRQVGVSTLLMAAVYERIMAIETPVFTKVPKKINNSFWEDLSPIVENEYAEKLPKYEKVVKVLSRQENWQTLKELIGPGLVTPSRLKSCLVKAGAAHRYGDIRDNGEPLKRGKFIEIVSNANQMRARFTVLDLAHLLGILPNQLGSLVDEWVAGES